MDTSQAPVWDDRLNALQLGRAEYVRRLGGQIQYLGQRVTEIVDAIDHTARPSAVLFSSGHGSGVRFDADHQLDGGSDLDLRSANLLAVLGLGAIDDRSTLVNILPALPPSSSERRSSPPSRISR